MPAARLGAKPTSDELRNPGLLKRAQWAASCDRLLGIRGIAWHETNESGDLESA